MGFGAILMTEPVINSCNSIPGWDAFSYSGAENAGEIPAIFQRWF